MLSCCHFQSCTPRPLWIQYLPHHPRMGWKGFVLKGNCGRTGAARLKRTTCRGKELEEVIPASTVSGGKEKQVIHWGIKENSFLNCWDLSVSFKVISEKKTRCEANVLPHLSWYQQIEPGQNLTAKYSTKGLWKRRGRCQQHNFSQRLLQILRLGSQTGKAHLWAKTAKNPFIWARSPWMPS